MKNASTEIIEIDGKEYTLFLNRKGIVAYEKFCKEENEKIKKLEEKYKTSIEKLEKSDFVIDENTNPFENLEDFDDLESDLELEKTVFVKIYWIMLYENHKLSLEEVKKLYDKAVEEYGEQQLEDLVQQMIEGVNINAYDNENKELKNLKALKPKK